MKGSNRTFVILATAMIILFVLGLMMVIVLASRQT
jgi:hypothetical protein